MLMPCHAWDAMGCHGMRCDATPCMFCWDCDFNGAVDVGGQACYASTPLCRHLRDLDLIALQLGFLNMHPDTVLALLLNKLHIEE